MNNSLAISYMAAGRRLLIVGTLLLFIFAFGWSGEKDIIACPPLQKTILCSLIICCMCFGFFYIAMHKILRRFHYFSRPKLFPRKLLRRYHVSFWLATTSSALFLACYFVFIVAAVV